MKSPELALSIANLQHQLVEISPEENSQEVLVACQKLASFAWLVDRIRFYRGLGLFLNFGTVTDGAIATRIINMHRKDQAEALAFHQQCHEPEGVVNRELVDHWGNATWYRRFIPGEELELLKFDENRVWFQDLEADVCEENFCYYRLLKRMDQMGGRLGLENIREDWLVVGGVEVHFTYSGSHHCLKPHVLDDWLDLHTCIEGVNAAIASSGYEFVEVDTGDQCGCFVFVKVENVERLFSRGLKRPEYLSAKPWSDGMPFDDE